MGQAPTPCLPALPAGVGPSPSPARPRGPASVTLPTITGAGALLAWDARTPGGMVLVLGSQASG